MLYRRVLFAWLWTGTLLSAPVDEDALLSRITARIQDDLNHLPDYVCGQTVERSRRLTSSAGFKTLDILRLDVGLAGNREMYSWQGAARFDEKELAELVDRGVIGSGSFALLARHVFLSRAARFDFRGEEMLSGRRAVRFDYEVPREHSSYRIRVPPRQAVVGFDGSFWADPETLDVIRLEVRALDIPEPLGLAEAVTVTDYARIPIGDSSALLPVSSDVRTVSLTGEESRNIARFSGCRKYKAESILSFGERSPERQQVPASTAVEIPKSTLLELSLAEDIDLGRARIGDPLRAVLVHPVRDGDRVIVPAGAAVLGHLLRVDRQAQPFEHYIVALQFHTLDLGDRQSPLAATLEDVAPAAGLIRQAKSLNPTFTPKRGPRMEILVGEQHPNEGVIHWDARHPQIRKGVKMRWRAGVLQ